MGITERHLFKKLSGIAETVAFVDMVEIVKAEEEEGEVE